MLAWLFDRDLHKHNSDEEIVRKEILAAAIFHPISSQRKYRMEFTNSFLEYASSKVGRR